MQARIDAAEVKKGRRDAVRAVRSPGSTVQLVVAVVEEVFHAAVSGGSDAVGADRSDAVPAPGRTLRRMLALADIVERDEHWKLLAA